MHSYSKSQIYASDAYEDVAKQWHNTEIEKSMKTLVEAQRSFFKTGATRNVEWRKQQIRAVRKLIDENQQRWQEALFKDLGKSKEQFAIELPLMFPRLDRMLEKLDEYVKPITLTPEFPLTPAEDDLVIVKEPLGVALIIAPWNGPLISLSNLIMPLASGNTVIFKPSELAPASASLAAELAPKYFDQQVVAIVNGGVAETTDLLKERFDHIFYTGCPPVAKIIMAAAAKHLTPVTLELGGKNPVFIDSTFDLDDAVKNILFAKTFASAQMCICPDYIMTTPDVKPKLLEAFQRGFAAHGDLRVHPSFGRIVNLRHFDRLHKLIKTTKGKLVTKSGDCDRNDLFVPLHLYDVNKDDVLLEEEIFGPLIPVLAVSSFDEAISYIQNHEKPLMAYYFTNDAKKADRFITETSSGGVAINDVMARAMDCEGPFGGVGNSGIGRINGKYGFDAFTHEKTVAVRNSVGKKMHFK